MAHGRYLVFNAVMGSAATYSNEIDLGGTFARVYVDMTGAASEVRFTAAATTGGTYRQVLLQQTPTSTVQSNIWKIGSATSGSIIEGPAGLRFMKLELTAPVTNGTTLKIFCSDL